MAHVWIRWKSSCLHVCNWFHRLWTHLFELFRCKKQYILKVINVFPKCIFCVCSMYMHICDGRMLIAQCYFRKLAFLERYRYTPLIILQFMQEHRKRKQFYTTIRAMLHQIYSLTYHLTNEHHVCLLLLHRFQGIAWIGCLCVREFTAVFFIDECACLFIALLACISAQGRLYGIVRAYGSL